MVNKKRRRYVAKPVVEHLETRILLAAKLLRPSLDPFDLEPVIVVFNDDVGDTRAMAHSQINAHGGRLRHIFEHTVRGFAGELPNSILQTLRDNPLIKRIEPDLKMQALAQTLPTGVDRIDADQNLVANIDGIDELLDVDIAILDSGIDADHPDLNVEGSVNFTSYGLDDNYGHGTHVAGIAAALDNDIGVVGVAPGARLWSVKVLGDDGNGWLSDIIEGIDWVTANADTIEVANMSLGGLGVSTTYHEAIKASVNAGVVYFAAAGNSYRDILGYDFQFGTSDDTIPAVYPEVATISAIADTDGQGGGGVKIRITMTVRWEGTTRTTSTLTSVISATTRALPATARGTWPITRFPRLVWAST